jgi:hypothetical protein
MGEPRNTRNTRKIFSPVGTFENSPIYCRERFRPLFSSRRDDWKAATFSSVPTGRDISGDPLPAMNCRAILKSPYGTEKDYETVWENHERHEKHEKY